MNEAAAVTYKGSVCVWDRVRWEHNDGCPLQ